MSRHSWMCPSRSEPTNNWLYTEMSKLWWWKEDTTNSSCHSSILKSASFSVIFLYLKVWSQSMRADMKREENCQIKWRAKWIQCSGRFSLGLPPPPLCFPLGSPKFEFSSSRTKPLEEWVEFHLQHHLGLSFPKSLIESMLINSELTSRRWRAFDPWLPIDLKCRWQ